MIDYTVVANTFLLPNNKPLILNISGALTNGTLRYKISERKYCYFVLRSLRGKFKGGNLLEAHAASVHHLFLVLALFKFA